VGHVAGRLYSITVDLRAFTRYRPVALRRARLWLERPATGSSSDEAPSAAPPIVTHWAFVDLY